MVSGGASYRKPRKGTKFEVYLPRVDGIADGALPEQIGATPVRGRKTVLIAEDEEAVRELPGLAVWPASQPVKPF